MAASVSLVGHARSLKVAVPEAAFVPHSPAAVIEIAAEIIAVGILPALGGERAHHPP